MASAVLRILLVAHAAALGFSQYAEAKSSSQVLIAQADFLDKAIQFAVHAKAMARRLSNFADLVNICGTDGQCSDSSMLQVIESNIRSLQATDTMFQALSKEKRVLHSTLAAVEANAQGRLLPLGRASVFEGLIRSYLGGHVGWVAGAGVGAASGLVLAPCTAGASVAAGIAVGSTIGGAVGALGSAVSHFAEWQAPQLEELHGEMMLIGHGLQLSFERAQESWAQVQSSLQQMKAAKDTWLLLGARGYHVLAEAVRPLVDLAEMQLGPVTEPTTEPVTELVTEPAIGLAADAING